MSTQSSHLPSSQVVAASIAIKMGFTQAARLVHLSLQQTRNMRAVGQARQKRDQVDRTFAANAVRFNEVFTFIMRCSLLYRLPQPIGAGCRVELASKHVRARNGICGPHGRTGDRG
jgi:hypothetical protein